MSAWTDWPLPNGWTVSAATGYENDDFVRGRRTIIVRTDDQKVGIRRETRWRLHRDGRLQLIGQVFRRRDGKWAEPWYSFEKRMDKWSIP